MQIIFTTALAALLLFSCRHSHEEQTDPPEETKQAILASQAVHRHLCVKNDSAILINASAKDACIIAPFAPQACESEKTSSTDIVYLFWKIYFL